MKNKILLIIISSCLIAFLSSCKMHNSVFDDQYISLDNGIVDNKTLASGEYKSERSSTVKVSVYSAVDNGDLVGFRIQPSIINSESGKGKVFIKNNPRFLIEQKIKEQIRGKGFKVSEDAFDKNLRLKLMYLTYRTKGGGLSVGLVCDIAINTTLYDNRGKLLYKKWHFISKEFGQYQNNKLEITTKNINESLNEIIDNIAADDAMIQQLNKAR